MSGPVDWVLRWVSLGSLELDIYILSGAQWYGISVPSSRKHPATYGVEIGSYLAVFLIFHNACSLEAFHTYSVSPPWRWTSKDLATGTRYQNPFPSLPSGLPVSRPYVICQLEEGGEPFIVEREISTGAYSGEWGSESIAYANAQLGWEVALSLWSGCCLFRRWAHLAGALSCGMLKFIIISGVRRGDVHFLF